MASSSFSAAPEYASTSKSAPVYDIAHLDTLLTSYLSLLDTYTRLRSSLSNDLSSGFFALAQAQRSSMLPPGRRYGEEMYDQRMKAGRRVRWWSSGEQGQGREQIVTGGWEVYKLEEAASVAARPPAGPTPETTSGSPPTKAPAAAEKTASELKIRDPLRWFGVLTPHPLRSCQSSFISATSTIPDLLDISRDMAALEDEITRVRQTLGLHEETAEDVGDDDRELDVAETQEEAKVVKEKTSPRVRGLPSRNKVSEPRSRVLKPGSS